MKLSISVGLALLLPAFAVAAEVIVFDLFHSLEWQTVVEILDRFSNRQALTNLFFLKVQLEVRDGGEMDISENHQCYVWGQCQVIERKL